MKVKIKHTLIVLTAITLGVMFLVSFLFCPPKETGTIFDIKLSGVENPIGYNLSAPTFTWKVQDSDGTRTEFAKIDITKEYSPEIVATKSVEGNANMIAFDYETEFLPILEPRTRYNYIITVTDNQGNQIISEPQYFETGKLNEPWEGQWITVDSNYPNTPVFKREFDVKKELTSARLYISGLGVYEAHLNSEKIGNEVLAPYFSHYATEVEYQTFDITDQIKSKNLLEVFLGDGWYKGRFTITWKDKNYGDSYNLIYEIHLNYTDGTTETIVSDENTTYSENYITFSNIYDGEKQDLRILDKEEESAPGVLTTEDQVLAINLIDRFSIPVVEKETIDPVELIKTPKNEYVIDFGQNCAGYVEVTHDLKKDQTLNLEYGETLQHGNFYDENFRTAEAAFSVISNGEPATSKPHFTYYGFRYVKVTGLDSPPKLDDFKAVVLYSDLASTGTLTTGNEKINQLISNTLWSQKSNFVNLPTDCPQRDERLGWCGDALVFNPTATYNMDTYAFFRKFLHEIRVIQLERDGAVPVVIPDDGITGNDLHISSVWSDVCTFLPISLYKYYGDINILKENYDMMKLWVDYIANYDGAQDQNYIYDFGYHYGDWLSIGSIENLSITPDEYNYYIATCYWAKSTRNVIEAASVLGKEEDRIRYEELYNQIVPALHRKYFLPDGSLSIDTQTAYLIALDFDLCPNKDLVVEALKERLKKDNYTITGGFVGGTRIIQILADNGLTEEATKILMNEKCPGWLYEVNLGATTIWERWNALDENGKVVDYWLGSLNHYAYGSVVEALYANYGGLKAAKPGFSEVDITPVIIPELGSSQVTYDSPAGKYEFSWEIQNDSECKINLVVPYGCKANVFLPGQEDQVYKPGSYEWTIELE